MQKKVIYMKLWLLLIIGAVLVSGCTTIEGGSVLDIAKTSPQVQEFLEQYPDASIKATYWNSESVSGIIEDIRIECGSQMEVKDYYKVEISSSDSDLVAWVDEANRRVDCVVITPETTTTTVPITTTISFTTSTTAISTTTISSTTVTTSTSTTSTTTTTIPETTTTTTTIPESNPVCGEGGCGISILTEGESIVDNFFGTIYNVTLIDVLNSTHIYINVNGEIEKIELASQNIIAGLNVYIYDVYCYGPERNDNQIKLSLVKDPINCPEDCEVDPYDNNPCHPDGCVASEYRFCQSGIGDCDSDNDCFGDLICCEDAGPYYGCYDGKDICMSQAACSALVAPPAFSPVCGDGKCEYTTIFNEGESRILDLNGTYYNITLEEIYYDGDAIELILNEDEWGLGVEESGYDILNGLPVKVNYIDFTSPSNPDNYANISFIENSLNCPQDC
jgi:hypothetical protein